MAMIGDVDDVLYAAFCEKLPSLEGEFPNFPCRRMPRKRPCVPTRVHSNSVPSLTVVFAAEERQQKQQGSDHAASRPRAGKIIAITGCTTGTGYAAAEACAKKGAHVLMLNRKSERADAALAKVKAAAPGATVAHIDCDLTSIQSMKATAVAVKGAVGKLDVLANNAGIMAFGDIATSEGYDIQMATNHLSHFLLTKELMPLLEASASSGGDPRIVNHSSGARKRQHVLLRANLEKNGGNLGGSSHGFMMSGPRWKRYQQTKVGGAMCDHCHAIIRRAFFCLPITLLVRGKHSSSFCPLLHIYRPPFSGTTACKLLLHLRAARPPSGQGIQGTFSQSKELGPTHPHLSLAQCC